MSERGAIHPLSSRPPRSNQRPSPALLRSLLARRGGFTIDGRGGRTIEEGVAVCIKPAAAFVFEFEDWCDHAVGRWMQRNEPDLGGGVFLGGWLDGQRRCWLDLVWVFQSEHVGYAVDLGRSLDQHAAFDLRRRSLIHLGDQSTPSRSSTRTRRPISSTVGSR